MRLLIGTLALALLVLASPAKSQLLLWDNFDDGDASGWSELDGTFDVVNGEYVIQSNAFCGDARATIGNPSWSDYTIECDFYMDTAAANRHAAALFRVEEIASGCDAGRYYQFSAHADFVQFCEMDYSAGACDILKTEPVATTNFEWHHLVLDVLGSTATAYVDGAMVLTYSGFTDYPQGAIGVKAVNANTNIYDNVLVYEPGTVLGWQDAGPGLAGTNGTPSLTADGFLLEGYPNGLSLAQAKPFSTAFLVLGLSAVDAPFKGGVLAPSPDLIVPFVTDGFGALVFGFPWPDGIPAGVTTVWQYWIPDPVGEAGFAASNAITGTTP